MATPKTKTNPKKIAEDMKLVDLTAGQLVEKIRELKAKIVQHQMDRLRGKVKNTRQGFTWRKEIARMQTVLKMKLLR